MDLEMTTQKAYAKINIGLDVLRRRKDGYHEVKMVMQTVDICDDLSFEKTWRPGIELCTDCGSLPMDKGRRTFISGKRHCRRCQDYVGKEDSYRCRYGRGKL